MDLSENYVYCSEVEITSAMLFEKLEMPVLQTPKKGLILELFQIQNSAAVPWAKFAAWVYALFGETSPTQPAQALRRSVTAIKGKRQYLLKNAAKRKELNHFLNEPFYLPSQGTPPLKATASPVPYQPQIVKEAIQIVNKSLAKEVAQLQDVCTTQKVQLDKKHERIRTLEQQYKPHNVRRRMQRKDAKIAKQKESIDKQARQLRQNSQQATKRAREQVRYYKEKCAQVQDQGEEDCEECKVMEEELMKLKARNVELMEVNAILNDELLALRSNKLTTYIDGKYTDSMRLCIMEILSHNVGINQVEPVIKAVLRLANLECDKLPQHTAISEMLLESRTLSQIQLAETLTGSEYTTLHSDGTTKFGHKYSGYQISTADKSLTLGLQVQC